MALIFLKKWTSLKLKEISYINSQCYAAGELKHGTISLIDEGTPVIAIATEDRIKEKVYSNRLSESFYFCNGWNIQNV